MTAGARVGTSFVLDPTDVNRIGRGTDCDVVLMDPLCSRVHAQVIREEDGWWIQDAGSRNGTLVHGTRIERAKLELGATIRMGSTEFVLNWSPEPPTTNSALPDEMIVREVQCDTAETNRLFIGEHFDGATEDLSVLYQLSLKLLSCEAPDDVIHHALEILHQRTRATVAGFLWKSDDGQLKPKNFIPHQALGHVVLSELLTDLVCRRGRAVWVANQPKHEAPSNYSDAICVPLIYREQTLGALHLYRQSQSFRQQDFDFSRSLGALLTLGLVRARQFATLQVEHQRLVQNSANFEELVGDSRCMQELRARIAKIARATGGVLIRGESGSGKELVARALHRQSSRSDRPLLSVNCGAIPADLIEGHLFGQALGASPGTGQERGWFQQADSGSLFLDEIGELSLAAQAKLLHVLEGHPFLPLGTNRAISVDVRVIAATRRDLAGMVARREFREDLYFRLTVFEIQIPPVRERGDDLQQLLNHFLDHFRKQHGSPKLKMTPDAYEKLREYHWPGNVREMRNVIDSAVVLAEQGVIGVEHLGLPPAPKTGDESLRLEDWEARLIRQALQRTEGKVPEAAEMLGISRATLYRKLETYHIERS